MPKTINKDMTEHEDAGQLLASILEHKDTSSTVCDYIADVVYEMAGGVTLATPEILRVAWPLIAAERELTGSEMMPFMMAIRAMLDLSDDGAIYKRATARAIAARAAKKGVRADAGK